MEDGDTQYCTSFSPLQLNLRDVAQTKGGMAEFLHQWCSSKDQYGTRLVGWLVGWSALVHRPVGWIDLNRHWPTPKDESLYDFDEPTTFNLTPSSGQKYESATHW